LLPAAQVRALFPDAAAFVDRHGAGPRTPSALRQLLRETRRRGYAEERGEVTPGMCSVAAAVVDHNGHPVAAVAVTYVGAEDAADPRAHALAAAARGTAAEISNRLRGGARRR
jgi:DNA-binding IclR family transcriptional regulator